MRSLTKRTAIWLGIVMVMSLLGPAFGASVAAQATPVGEPTETVEPTVVPTTAPEPTETIEPTVAPTVAPEPTETVEPTELPATPPAGPQPRSMGIQATPLEIVLTGPATVRPGDDLTYTLTVTNTSGRTFELLSMGTDILPTG